MITFKGKAWLDVEGVSRALAEASVGPLANCALRVERYAKSITSKGGRMRGAAGPRGGAGKVSSEPSPVGQPPHRQTGTLSNSITTARTETGTYLVGPTTVAWYGAIHEHSDRFPRQFMRPALDHEWPSFPAEFRDIRPGDTPTGRKLNARRGRGRGGR